MANGGKIDPMFWRAKSPLDPGDEAWQLECWAWLLRNLGGVGLLRATALVLPTRDFFRPLTSTGHAFAAEVLDQVAAYFGFEPGDFRLVAQASSINPQVGAFALAMFLALTKRKPDQARPHLEGAAAAYFNKAVKYLAAHPSVVANLTG